MDKQLDRLLPLAQNAWRIAIGFAFFTHGGQKLLGWFGSDAVGDFTSLVGAAGFLELFGGLAIMMGLLTRPVAFVLSGQMAVAYWYQHARMGGPWPWANGGELALLYCFTFLLMAALGGGGFSVDGLRQRSRAPDG